MGQSYYLPLVQLAIPTLRACSRPQTERFQRVMHTLIRSDNHVSLFEWCVVTMIDASIAAAAGNPVQSRTRPRRLKELPVQARVILALLAQAEPGAQDANRCYVHAMEYLQLPAGEMYPRQTLHFRTLDNALRQLDHLLPLEKQRFITASVMAVEADGTIASAEIEVLRAIAAALHVPAPAVANARPHRQ